MHNRNRLSLIFIAVLICMLMTAFSGCQKQEAAAPTTAATEPATAETTVASAPELTNSEESGALRSWELTPKVWSSSNGATITLTAIPRAYSQDQAVYFVVHLNGEKVEDVPCAWDGTAYAASVDLEAADGYEYECVVFQGQGEGESFMLSDAYDSLVYLQTSLAAYCNLYISDFKVENDQFTVTAGFAHVQLPQLTIGSASVAFEKAELVFQLNGEDIETQPVELPKGEGVGSHEASLSAISFKMPQMDDDYQLDLMLSVTLSDGQQLTANGGSWFYNNGELKMSAG